MPSRGERTASGWPVATAPGPRGVDRGRVRHPVRRVSRRAHETTSPKTSVSTATTLARSVHAFRDGIERRIDYATVNDRFFVNNVSLGVYAALVQQDGYRDAKVETTKTMLPELLGKTNEPFDLQFAEPDGTEVDGAFIIQVSNNPYALGSSIDAGQRRRIDTGELGVIALTGTTGKDAAGLLALDAVGRRNRSRNWHEFTTASFEVRSRSGTAFAGVDGEALEMATPMVFRIYPRRSSSPGARRKPRSGGATSRPQRQPPRPARRRTGTTMMAPTSSEQPARRRRPRSRAHRSLSGGGPASRFTTAGRPRPPSLGRSQ